MRSSLVLGAFTLAGCATVHEPPQQRGPGPPPPPARPANVAFVQPPAEADAGAVERLAWLAGCWDGALANGASYEESWLAPRGGSMIGVARMTRDGRTLSWEYMRIVSEDGDLVYIAEPSGQTATRFVAAEISATTAIFANPAHDFPQRILYRLTPPDELRARIEGERDGQPRGIDFPLRRVACAG